jgi:hypothetical protein
MKRCQTCGLVLDDSQTFCTNDGTPLIADSSSYDPRATLVAPPGSIPTTPPGGGATQGARTDWQSPARPTIQPGYAPQAGYEQPAVPRPGKFVPGLIGGLVAGILSLRRFSAAESFHHHQLLLHRVGHDRRRSRFQDLHQSFTDSRQAG